MIELIYSFAVYLLCVGSISNQEVNSNDGLEDDGVYLCEVEMPPIKEAEAGQYRNILRKRLEFVTGSRVEESIEGRLVTYVCDPGNLSEEEMECVEFDLMSNIWITMGEVADIKKLKKGRPFSFRCFEYGKSFPVYTKGYVDFTYEDFETITYNNRLGKLVIDITLKEEAAGSFQTFFEEMMRTGRYGVQQMYFDISGYYSNAPVVQAPLEREFSLSVPRETEKIYKKIIMMQIKYPLPFEVIYE